MLYGKCCHILTQRGIASPPAGSFQLQDDGTGPYIADWNSTLLGPQPTQADLASVSDTQANDIAKDLNAARVDADMCILALGRVCWEELQKCTPQPDRTLRDLAAFRARVKAVYKNLL